jgi:peptide deformylase
MIRSILIHPDPRLKKPSKPVAAITSDIRTLAEDMLRTMYEAPGIGLAAPQVGVLKRVLVMDCVKDPALAPRPLVMVNPVVTWASEDVSTYDEGCLSIPDQYAEIERPAEVRSSRVSGRPACSTRSTIWTASSSSTTCGRCAAR